MPLSVTPPDVAEAEPWQTAIAPDPLVQTLQSLALARSLGVAARLGIFSELLGDPVDVEVLANTFVLQIEPLRNLLDVLTAAGYLGCRDGRYFIAAAARQWLDPDSPTSLATSLSYSLEHWSWWSELDQVLAGGAVARIEPDLDDKCGWMRRVRSQFEQARRIADDLADAVELPRYAQSVLDLGSPHGWYSAVLCQRNPMLRSTVIDCAPGIAAGRELIWEAGLERVVTHQAGDIFNADLGGPHDAVVCMPLLHRLDDDQTMTMLARVRAALAPGGLLITLRSMSVDSADPDPQLASTALLLRLVSRSDPCSPIQFDEQLAASGFAVPRIRQLASAPELFAYVARAI